MIGNEHTALSPALDRHLRALAGTAPAHHASEAAQRRLERRLSGTPETARPELRAPLWRRWSLAAGTALALMLVVMPLMIGHRDALAFADVQRHFQQFRTLAMTVEHKAVGELLQHVRVILDDTGRVRADVAGELSVVVDPDRGRVLMLMHSSKSALWLPVAVDNVMPAREALSWIDELREFKGIATQFPETRLIDGRTAHGWSLGIGSARLQLWADADGLPLTLGIGEGDGEALSLQLRFRFDEPVPTDAFSTDIPSGYTFGWGS